MEKLPNKGATLKSNEFSGEEEKVQLQNYLKMIYY